VDWVHVTQGSLVMCSSEHGNEFLGSVKGEEFLN
jgi:hypothetical protein